MDWGALPPETGITVDDWLQNNQPADATLNLILTRFLFAKGGAALGFVGVLGDDVIADVACKSLVCQPF